MEVKQINILTTSFLRISGGEETIYPNSVLATKTIVNLKGEPDPYEHIELNLDPNTDESKIAEMEKRIKKFINDRRPAEDIDSYCSVTVKEIGTVTKIDVYFTHIVSDNDVTQFQRFETKNQQRSQLLRRKVERNRTNKEIRNWKTEMNSATRQTKTYAEVVKQNQRTEKHQLSYNGIRTTLTKSVQNYEFEAESENLEWLEGCFVGQTYDIGQIATSLNIRVKEREYRTWVSEEEAGVSLFRHVDNHKKTQQGHNEERDGSSLEGREEESNKTNAVKQSLVKNTEQPVSTIPSPVKRQNTGSNPDQSSSRWSSHDDREETILEICDRHNSPVSSRHDCKKAIAEERGKQDTNDGALIVWQ
ncbi:hypothetical protein Ancab_012475 [Ancistrocladus abbreviatus]